MPVNNVQPTYNRFMNIAVVGMVDDMQAYNIVTRNCEPSAGIAFGLAVGQGAKDKGGILGGAEFVGISVRDPTIPQILGVNPDVYAQNQNMNVLTRGGCAVNVKMTVVAQDPVYYNTTTGEFGNAAGTGLVLIPGASWKTSAVGTSGTPALAMVTLGIQK